ncbi:MAG: GDSL-type esterase/lipase family protein, partial [Pseudomonadota bacterium]
DARLRIEPKVSKLSAVVSTRWARDVKRIEDATRSDVYDVAIVMVGAFDQASLRTAGKKRIRLGDDAWRQGYLARVSRLMAALKKRRVAVYWIGQPPAQGPKRSQHALVINELVREAALRYRVKMIDVYDSFVGENGGFASYGADVEGKVRRLRWKDGLHFTRPGYMKIAHFVYREIRRDLRQARSERMVELVGDDAAQKQIRARVARRGQANTQRWSTETTAAEANGSEAAASPTAGPAAKQSDGLPAETATVAIPSAPGATKRVKISIVRPAVAPSVMRLLTRNRSSERSAQLGDTVALQDTGGGQWLQTVTPLTRGTLTELRAKSAPTQMPFFKVWAKGERLAPRDNRADDAAWPRPQPVVLIRPVAAQPETADARDLDAFKETVPAWDGPPIPERNPEAL